MVTIDSEDKINLGSLRPNGINSMLPLSQHRAVRLGEGGIEDLGLGVKGKVPR